MAIYTKNNTNIMLVRIPKTGSTSLNVSFQQDEWRTILTGGHKLPKWFFDKKHFSIEMLDYIFVVLRDPVDRFISLYRMVQPTKKYKFPKDVDINTFWNMCKVIDKKRHTPPIPNFFNYIETVKHYILPQTKWVPSFILNNRNTKFFLYDRKNFCMIYNKLNSILNSNLKYLHKRDHLEYTTPDELCTLNKKTIEDIKDFYRGDYSLINSLF
tara:strand:+ start:1490 stop:2125 length:636 start_codon:yes stop_codon:yes gene_type:complete